MKALITGITGQDGSYLAEMLLDKGYEVHGMVRKTSAAHAKRIGRSPEDAPGKKLFLHAGDLQDSEALLDLVLTIRPDEIYNLAAQSHVRTSFEMPEYTGDVVGLGVTRILEAVRKSGAQARIFQASSSEMFGSAPSPQNERTPLDPKNPYAAAKVYAYHMVRNYRESYGTFASNGILFNHESPRRGENFVTRKITKAVARIGLGRQDCILLGNLDVRKDWGYAPDYADAMWRILQADKPDDFVVATGECRTVREFCRAAFSEAGMEIEWRGNGPEETGVLTAISEHKLPSNERLPDKDEDDRGKAGEKQRRNGGHEAGTGSVPLEVGNVLVRIDPQLFRPTDAIGASGDASKAKRVLGWSPTTSFDELVRIMVRADIENAIER